MDNSDFRGVVTLPTAASDRVKNPKTRGRPKGTVSLRVERNLRQDRATLEPTESPYHPMVPCPQTPIKGRFHYPKELLLQRYMCRGGHGDWRGPSLCPRTLIAKSFISPLNSLLHQLEAEGHDVNGAKLELLALRDMARFIADLGTKLAMGPESETIEQEEWDFDPHPPGD